jgi:hypothetical protein
MRSSRIDDPALNPGARLTRPAFSASDQRQIIIGDGLLNMGDRRGLRRRIIGYVLDRPRRRLIGGVADRMGIEDRAAGPGGGIRIGQRDRALIVERGLALNGRLPIRRRKARRLRRQIVVDEDLHEPPNDLGTRQLRAGALRLETRRHPRPIGDAPGIAAVAADIGVDRRDELVVGRPAIGRVEKAALRGDELLPEQLRVIGRDRRCRGGRGGEAVGVGLRGHDAFPIGKAGSLGGAAMERRIKAENFLLNGRGGRGGSRCLRSDLEAQNVHQCDVGLRDRVSAPSREKRVEGIIRHATRPITQIAGRGESVEIGRAAIDRKIRRAADLSLNNSRRGELKEIHHRKGRIRVQPAVATQGVRQFVHPTRSYPSSPRR